MTRRRRKQKPAGPPRAPWPGFERIGGRLAGSMPMGFVVIGQSDRWPGFGPNDIGVEYISTDHRHGSVLYVPRRSGDPGWSLWMDADALLAALHDKSIEPYGEYTLVSRRPPGWRETAVSERRSHIVADFNTIEDLVQHAADELGATHAIIAGPETRIYFPRGGDYPYEEARVFRKAGYWHADGPHMRPGVSHLPPDAEPLDQPAPSRRAAEGPRPRLRESAPPVEITYENYLPHLSETRYRVHVGAHVVEVVVNELSGLITTRFMSRRGKGWASASERAVRAVRQRRAERR